MKEAKFKIVITDYNLADLKKLYKRHYGEGKTPTKKDLERWFASLLKADLDSINS